MKRDVQRFSWAPLWLWPCTLRILVKTWSCRRRTSRASLRYCGKGDVVEPETSTLQKISMWNWVWCVQTKMTQRSSTNCMDPSAGKALTMTLAALRSWCGTVLWRSSTARLRLRSKSGRAKETAFTQRQLGDKRQEWKSQLDYIIGPRGRRGDDDSYIYNDVKL